MKKYKTYLKYFIYFVISVSVIIISYRSAKPRYKPEHYTDIFKDFSWLNDWPIKGRTNYPLLFNRKYQAKKAHQALIELISVKNN